MAAPMWAEVSRFISRPSTLLLYFIKFLSLSLFAFASPLTSLWQMSSTKKEKDKLNGSSPAAEEGIPV